jgi:hypothetical protein
MADSTSPVGGMVTDVEAAVGMLESAADALHRGSASLEVQARGDIERLVRALERLDAIRNSLRWAEDWV